MSALRLGDNVTPLFSRAVAITRGDLIDASRRASRTGFTVPVAFTRAAYTPALRADLDEVLTLVFLAAARISHPTERISVDTVRHGTLIVRVDVDDNGGPAVTVTTPEER